MRGRSTASVVASPVLVGAVTLLIVIVGVFLAYNANNGLPFVPTYELKAELPNGQKLVKGNDVRVGGFRVGVVSDIQPAFRDGKAVALITMKLEKTMQPLARDSIVAVRPRSSLGLKYVELTPGTSKAGWTPGDTIPLAEARKPTPEYEDVFSTFDKKTRDNSRTALKGFGDAFGGRGASINEAIAAFNPFFRHLTPVMQTLSDPNTKLENFFRNIGRASAEAAPVAKAQADVFGKMAKTFAAFSACAGCLQQTIEKSPPSLQAGIDSFRVQEPFLLEFTKLSRKLRPTVATLHAKLATINLALETGEPVLRRTVKLNNLTGDVFRSLESLARQPQTELALRDLHTTFQVTRPLAEYVNPFQSVCNTAVAFFTGLSAHISLGTSNGTAQNALVKAGAPEGQENSFFDSLSQRPADVPANWDPQKTMDAAGHHFQVAHLNPYSPAVDAQGNADCQNGQYGYLNGPWNGPDAKYKPADLPPGASEEQFKEWEANQSGGSHTQTRNDSPGLAGPTFVARKLGINNIKDVP